ncbi:ATP phosphoribosyltransferase [Candidatus Hodgkinia cicadicola]
MSSVLALPSKGRVGAELSNWLPKLGLHYVDSSLRSYRNEFVGYSGVTVRLMPAGVVASALIRGDVDFGLTGLDLISELSLNRGASGVSMHCKYALSQAEVSVLVPKHWIDFNCLSDLRMLSLIKRAKVTTKYVNLTKRFFAANQLSFLEVFRSEGVTELEPFVGDSDFVVDLVSTGDTILHNSLKRVSGGTVLSSCLCLFCRINFKASGDALGVIRALSGLPML